jgi:hypothetical protein
MIKTVEMTSVNSAKKIDIDVKTIEHD